MTLNTRRFRARKKPTIGYAKRVVDSVLLSYRNRDSELTEISWAHLLTLIDAAQGHFDELGENVVATVTVKRR